MAPRPRTEVTRTPTPDLALTLTFTCTLTRTRTRTRTRTLTLARSGLTVPTTSTTTTSHSARWSRPELTRTPRGLRRVRTGYAYQRPAYCTYHRRRVACPQGANPNPNPNADPNQVAAKEARLRDTAWLRAEARPALEKRATSDALSPARSPAEPKPACDRSRSDGATRLRCAR